MADYSKLTKRELIMTLYARDLMLENERKRLEYLTEKYFELKQQLHDLPKKIVEEIRTYCNLKEFNPEFVDKQHQECIVSYTELIDFLDTILKKYGGEDE